MTACLYSGHFSDTASSVHTLISGGNYIIEKIHLIPYFLHAPAAGTPTALFELHSLALNDIWQATAGFYTGGATYIGYNGPGWNVDFPDGLPLPEADTLNLVTTLSNIDNCSYNINIYGQNLDL